MTTKFAARRSPPRQWVWPEQCGAVLLAREPVLAIPPVPASHIRVRTIEDQVASVGRAESVLKHKIENTAHEAR